MVMKLAMQALLFGVMVVRLEAAFVASGSQAAVETDSQATYKEALQYHTKNEVLSVLEEVANAEKLNSLQHIPYQDPDDSVAISSTEDQYGGSGEEYGAGHGGWQVEHEMRKWQYETAKEREQRILEEELTAAEDKHFAVKAKINGVKRIVKSDEKHHEILKTKGLLTDDRNAQNYIQSADSELQGKITLKQEKRAHFAAEVIEQKQLGLDIAARVVKKQEQAKVVEAKYADQETERLGLVELKKKEAKLNRAVTESQISRLSDVQAKLDLDKRGIDALTGKLSFEAKREIRLTAELKTVVDHDEEMTKEEGKLTAKTMQLDAALTTLNSVNAAAAQAKIDCAKKKELGLIK